MSRARRLSLEEVDEVIFHVAEPAKAGLPLQGDLVATAAGVRSRRVADVLRATAEALQRGASLEEALAAQSDRFPRQVQGVVQAGVQSGNLSTVLDQFLQHRRAAVEMRHALWHALAYPLLVLALLTLLFAFLLAFVVPPLQTLFGMWEAESYAPTAILVWLSLNQRSLWIGLGTALGSVMLLNWLAPALVQRGLKSVPLLGPAWRYAAMADFTRMLALLVEQQVPLPDALRLVADSTADADLGQESRRLAGRVAQGEALSEAVPRLPYFSRGLTPLLAWGERHAALPEALRGVGEMFAGRAQASSMLVRTVVPPFVFLVVAGAALFVVVAISAPISGSWRVLEYGPPPQGVVEPLALHQATAALSLLLLGVVALICRRLLFAADRSRDDDVQTILLVVANVVILIGLMVLSVLLFTFWLALSFWFAFAFVWNLAASNIRNAQRSGLLHMLAAATERGLPLIPVVHAFAGETRGRFAKRVSRLAHHLEPGLPLSEALAKVPRALPENAVLAARVGEATNRLGPVLRDLAGRDAEREPLWRGATVKVYYLGWLFATAAMIIPPFLIIVTPKMGEVFSDFAMPLPPLSQALVDVANSGGPVYWLMVVPPVVALAVLFVGMYELGWIRWRPPLLGRMLIRLDATTVLRALAWTAEAGLPFSGTLDALRQSFPHRGTRRRLARVERRLERGDDWCRSLRAGGWIGATDAALLQSAQRLGNLPWALREAAEGGERRFTYRLQSVLQVAGWLLIVMFGGLVLLFVIAYFLPLVVLIEGMTTY